MPSTPIHTNTYEINIALHYDIKKLEKKWLALESVSIVPFFLSWAWISTWIKTYTPKLYIVTANYEHKLIAIGLFTSSIERRHLIVNAKQLRLNQTGKSSEDQVWVEYNDFICEEEHKEFAVSACLNFIVDHEIFYGHDEIIISMISKRRAKQLTHSIKNCEVLLTRPCYNNNLTSIKNKSSEYIQTLKSNTRYQIRRSIRRYEKSHGLIELIHTKSTKDALNFFTEIAPLHIERWYDSGYKNDDFIDFHHRLIKAYYDDGRIHLIKVNAGKTTIAILYYLIKDSTVSFYLQGLLYEQDKILKPGLVAHCLATQYFMNQGMTVYDYMGGYSQYKTQLANRAEDLATIQIQKPKLKFFLGNIAKIIKSKVIRKL